MRASACLLLLALSSCKLVESLRKNVDPEKPAARLQHAWSHIDVAGEFKRIDRDWAGLFPSRDLQRIGAWPKRIEDGSAESMRDLRHALAPPDVDAQLGKAARAFRTAPERLGLLRGAPRDESDPIRRVDAGPRDPYATKSLLERTFDRFPL